MRLRKELGAKAKERNLKKAGEGLHKGEKKREGGSQTEKIDGNSADLGVKNPNSQTVIGINRQRCLAE